jgi:KDO2-lipid IV(A) lauroyltransferase
MYKFFSLLVKFLPTSLLNLILKSLAYIAFRLDKKHTRIISSNLDFALNHQLNNEAKKNIAQRVYYNLIQNIIGLMKRENLPAEKLLKNVQFVNKDILYNALKNKQKIIFITGHYSNWELIPPALTTKFGIELAIIGRKLDSEIMDQILVKNREQYNVKMIYRKGAMKEAIKVLKQNKALGLLLDQHLAEKQGGIKVNFFGKSVTHSPAVSILARNFDAAVIPVFISTDNYENHTLTFYEPLPVIKTDNKEEDILKMTQAQADITQKVIENKPEEWFWVHKRWKAYFPELYK